jgi:hypothetical protein
MRSDIHATRRIGQQGSLPTFAAPAQTVPKTTDFGTVLKVGSADEVTIGRIEPKVCCRGEEIKNGRFSRTVSLGKEVVVTLG